ncbi:MAG TPA: OmpA family protein [Coxiellaceae bacterium]|nr:OmpA family protein [Coxiellaceae bacterium]
MRFLKGFIVVVGLSLVLISCSQSKPMRGGYSGAPSSHSSMIKDLEQSGMQVVQQGNWVTIVLPARNFFKSQKGELLPGQAEALLDLAAFVRTYPYSPVKVLGFSDNIGTPGQQYYRSLNEAEIVAAFLWRGGVALDRTTIQALGAGDTVASNATPPGRNANERVEVWINRQ